MEWGTGVGAGSCAKTGRMTGETSSCAHVWEREGRGRKLELELELDRGLCRRHLQAAQMRNPRMISRYSLAKQLTKNVQR
jgi:hypothetical protein